MEAPELSSSNTINSRGMDLIRDPHLNKGTGFSLRERQLLNLHGLLPPAFMSQETQARRVMKNLRNAPNDLSRYVQMNSLQDRNERLFYRVLMENIEELLPIVYTPTVGLACQNYGFIFRKPKGLYITIHDNTVERIYNILCNWPESIIKAIVVSDGERILGLGDLGASGMGIPVGKMSLYVSLARVHPRWCLPIMLDVGTNNKNFLNDPFYIGLKQKRVRGVEYDYFLDNFMKAVTRRFGQTTLVQFEDFANHNAFRLLDRYKNEYCTFNDDIQGTASVALSGLFGACKISGMALTDQKILFFGAGEAATGIAMLTCKALQKAGLSEEEAKNKIYMIDINGLLVESRSDLDHHRKMFAKNLEPMRNLIEIIEAIKPTCLIGASSVAGAFNEQVLRLMSKLNKRPIIFALSNPTSRAECTAVQAYQFSD
uniref:Malic enzyme n=1 Tax=Romanomermis culicivorax TaxID=13658 RepID=A0A915HLV8_ROMCU